MRHGEWFAWACLGAFAAPVLALQAPVACAATVTWATGDGGNGHAYELVETPVYWNQARADASTRQPPVGFQSGQLASIESASENAFLARSFVSGTRTGAWIGFTDEAIEGEWRWLDGTPGIWQDPRNFPSPVQTAYTNWIPGEPNDFAIGEDYGLFSCETGYFPGGWNDGAGPTGGTPFSYIVEYVAVPEPSACFSLTAGLAFGGWHVSKRRRRRTASVISRSIAALLLATAVPAYAVNYEMVTVGNAGNAADTTGYGAVAYEYQIGKYEVSISQYCDFLNAVAATDVYGLYDSAMAVDQNTRGISQGGLPGANTYSLIGPSGTAPAGANSPGDRPITYVSWFDAARFANWMSNGQPTGAQGPTITENGAYAINGAVSGAAPAINETNPNTGMAPLYRIPIESEWYKAAYYDPTLNSGFGGYWSYATRSNAVPDNTLPNGSANYRRNLVFTVTQSTQLEGAQNYLTNVDAFHDAASFYDTFNQSGGVTEWNDLTGAADSVRCLRGGHYRSKTPTDISSAFRSGAVDPSDQTVQSVVGFRLAAPIAVPEPNACMGLAASLAFGGWHVSTRSRRRKAGVRLR